MKKKKIVKNKKNKSIILRLLIIAVCCYFAISLADLWGQLNDSRKELDEQNKIKEKLIQDIQNIEALNSVSDDELYEKAARERLGYIKSGEEVYVGIDY